MRTLSEIVERREAQEAAGLARAVVGRVETRLGDETAPQDDLGRSIS